MSDPTNSPMPDVTPIPRDAGSSLMSEILPVNSRTTRFWKSKVLVPALATVATTMLLFTSGSSSLDDFWNYAFILGLFIVFMIFYALYIYGGSRKPLWVFAFPFLLTVVFFLPPLGFIVFNGIATLFRDILPGGEVQPGSPFSDHFVSHFFGAGMCEELFKALPVFIMIWMGYLAKSRMDRPVGRFLEKVSVSTPLDGLLAGAAAGAGFIAFETFGQYYMNTFASTAAALNNEYAGVAAALQLAIPRALQGLVGHMAWAGIFGYFIGLALRRPSLSVPLILFGWIVPSAMHGFWNAGAISLGSWAMWASGMTTIVFFLATLLKARQLEPRTAPLPHEGSVAVGVAAPYMASVAPSPQIAAAPVRAVAQAVPASTPSQAVERLVLTAGTHVFAAEPGRTISPAGRADLEKLGAGFVGEVNTHPSDAAIIGLKNLGSRPWTLFSPKGVSQVVEPGRSARLEPGARIVHGDLVFSVSRAS